MHYSSQIGCLLLCNLYLVLFILQYTALIWYKKGAHLIMELGLYQCQNIGPVRAGNYTLWQYPTPVLHLL